MSIHPVLAYLDAGSGAAIAAVVASGAVGARVVASNVMAKFRRRPSADDRSVVDAEVGEPEAQDR